MNETRIVFVDELCAPGRITAIEAKAEKPFGGQRFLVDSEIASHFRIMGLLIDGETQPDLAQMVEGMQAGAFTDGAEGAAAGTCEFDRCLHSAVLLVRNVSAEPKPFRGKLMGVEAEGEAPDAEAPREASELEQHLMRHTQRLTEMTLEGMAAQIETLTRGNVWLSKAHDWLMKRYEKSTQMAMAVLTFANEAIGDDAVKKERLSALLTKYLDEPSDAPAAPTP